MFLTVGDKIKVCRKKYGLKQAIFESYGVTQYYLSLIENNKRNPSEDTIESIYKALVELTDGKVCLEYTYVEFMKSPYTQAKEWLNQEYKIRGRYDQELFEVAKKFNVLEVLYEVYQQFAGEEKQNRNYQKSNEYFQEAIQCGLLINKSPLDIYKKMATNLKLNLNNEGALAYYRLALNYAITDEDKYKMKYYIGIIESNLGNFDKALECADENIKYSEDTVTVVASILLKEHVMRKMGHYKGGRIILEEYLKSPLGNELLDVIYYNLGCNYSEDRKYLEALEVCFKILKKSECFTENIRYKTILLVGHIYKNIEKLEEGLEFIESIKDEIFQEKDQRFIRWFYEIYIEILIKLNKHEVIFEVLKEIKELNNENFISNEVFNQLYLLIAEYIIFSSENNQLKKYLLLTKI